MISGIRWISELIEIAGGTDVFADKSRGPQANDRRVSSDDVIAARPDVMLASWCGKPLDREAVLRRPGWSVIPAIASGNIHELPAEIILQPGPACLTDGLDLLEALLT
jgi:iron complex transport system substrate-binding protein